MWFYKIKQQPENQVSNHKYFKQRTLLQYIFFLNTD